jgi:hypothetical protein
MERIIAEAKLSLAIVAELTLGFLTWLLVLGLLPTDRLNFNVLGSLVMAVVCALPYEVARRYTRAHLTR